MARAESALVFRVPEAEQAVRALRDQCNPAAAVGMPAHITVLYPFKAPEAISRTDIGKLAAILPECKPFTFRLSAAGRFGRKRMPSAPARPRTRRGAGDSLQASWRCQ